VNPAIIQGGLYAGKKPDGSGYIISKVLAVDFAVHVRIYREEFVELPPELGSARLTVAVGHAPMSVGGWDHTQVLLGRETVTEDELAGYRHYMGG